MMDDKGESEHLRAAFRSLAANALPTDSCPESEKLWDGLRGELPPDELRDVVDHTAACPTCGEAWRIGLELERELAREADAPAPAREGRSTPAWWRWAAVAAGVVGVLGLAQIGPWTDRGPTTYRDAATSGIVSLVAEDTPLPADACVLRWNLELPGDVAHYEIRVMTEDLRPVAEGRDLESPSFQVPASDLAELAPGSKLLWQVEAVMEDGGRVESETFDVLLR